MTAIESAPGKLHTSPEALSTLRMPALDVIGESMSPERMFWKYQLTPYCNWPPSFTSATCASMCTCSGITSRRSMTSLIERQAAPVERTSRVLVSSTADTPTLSPPTSSVTAPLPLPWLFWFSDRLPLPRPPVPDESPLSLPFMPIPAELVPLVSSIPESWISVGLVPGISEVHRYCSVRPRHWNDHRRLRRGDRRGPWP